ncbi:protein-export chaperone SecB [Pseudomonas sp. Z8(2022)]|uniref:protein-export chaperone SecB n=1 Tax=Pseudomonas sp. Z8(2022) TaxID=2962597 RepID=UPI0021F4FDE0|nr:protein-export chaperone SecB [Pseudomonas sp. Z8(2022)]UYP31949.1 protein-export chaperone SecB [Pseudomonas sp. Z8(2022)]
MRLTLHTTKAIKVSIKQYGLPEDRSESEVWLPSEVDDMSSEEEMKFNLSHAPAYASEPETEAFAVVFSFSALVPNQSLEVDVEYIAEFVTDSPISEDFKKSHFPKVNAPAIAFPYLRAFISNLLLNSGYSPLILPSINFAAKKVGE